MKAKRATLSLCLIAVSALFSSYSYAAKIPDCGKREPSKTLPTPQDSEYDAYRNAKTKAVAGGPGNTVFNNNEGRLPAAGKNEVYYEYYLGIGGDGGAGSHRAVLLVQTSGKRKLVQRYYTQDHYASFCSLKN
ncbi:ribonuclease domain-containing protein [Janthinobacterium agaricidamnosum]|uniref:Ribonuclease family protein n=1 Tax=Janthinobacterium agaricidamnosum NBRC 102515 = DSM 9628 TaxID=1349767 RepID=W0UYB9_9BURK|nr:ribonuclease domain-containing protein [Janthinobacterium agaricidamnosum]CDG81549.1 ribonuclease family protein [Janthinobacterium agaricidamnosum NBRC 102515 = DSM 9628]